MNFTYLIIGVLMVIAGSFIIIRDIRSFIGDMRDKGKSKIVIIIDRLVFAPLFLGGILFFFGVLLFLKSFGVVG